MVMVTAWRRSILKASRLAVATLAAHGLVASRVGPVAAQSLQTNLAHVILVDSATGSVLFQRGADDPMTPASTAKIMTADLVFDLLRAGTLRKDQLFVVSELAWRQGGAPSRGSTMFAKLKSQISVDDLLRGLIVDSANDAAIVLAEGIAGSQGAFATRMTDRARDLGLDHLTFTDAWGGANPDQHVTAREMALLANHLIKTYPDLYPIFGERDFLWNNIKQPNRNPLLAMDLGADGLKTGNIDETGFSIVGSALQNGRRLIVAIYGASSASERAEEARKILQWGFRAFETRKVFSAGDIVGTAQVFGGDSRDVPLVTPSQVDVLAPRDGSEKITATIAYKGPLIAPVAADQPLASLRVYRGTTEALVVPLRTARAVPVGSLSKRAFNAALEYVGALVRKYVFRS